MNKSLYSHLVDTSRIDNSDIPENLAVNVTSYTPGFYVFELGVRVNGTRREHFQTSDISSFSKISDEKSFSGYLETKRLQEIADNHLPGTLGPLFPDLYVFVNGNIHKRPKTNSLEHQQA